MRPPLTCCVFWATDQEKHQTERQNLWHTQAMTTMIVAAVHQTVPQMMTGATWWTPTIQTTRPTKRIKLRSLMIKFWVSELNARGGVFHRRVFYRKFRLRLLAHFCLQSISGLQTVEMSAPRTIGTDLSNLKFKGPDTASDQQILEAAILYFIVKLPPDKQPSEGDEIDVSNWIRGRLPRKFKSI